MRVKLVRTESREVRQEALCSDTSWNLFNLQIVTTYYIYTWNKKSEKFEFLRMLERQCRQIWWKWFLKEHSIPFQPRHPEHEQPDLAAHLNKFSTSKIQPRNFNLLAKALAIWEQNSTAIPVAMTKLTNETAFKEMSQATITPIRLRIIKNMVIATQSPVAQPSISIVIAVTAKIQMPRFKIAS